MGDVQPLPADAKVADADEDKSGKQEDGLKASKNKEEKPEEMSFFEKLALKAARIAGTVAVEAVFQEKVCSDSRPPAACAGTLTRPFAGRGRAQHSGLGCCAVVSHAS